MGDKLSMPITDPNAIKEIVRTNFDKSAELYDQFESKFGLFEALTMELAMTCNLRAGMQVCDIGCGTGTSSFILQHLVGSNGKVIGMDFSSEMLAIAQKRLGQRDKSNLDFILCDANELDENINFELDCIMYNACIFLIPDPDKTLQSAYSILKLGGSVAMNYLVGMYDTNFDGELPKTNLFERARLNNKSFAPYGRAILNIGDLPSILESIGYKNIRSGIVSIELPIEAINAFYSIPAQSAALWPKQSYEERLPLLESLLNYYQEIQIEKYYQYWGWCVGEK